MRLLNLGCGTKASAHPNAINIDWSVYLRLRRLPLVAAAARIVLDEPRRPRLAALPSNVMVHNLAKGIPFADGSVDVVYHSHFLEHLDRRVVPGFFAEVRRVVKPGGTHRVVVPDLEQLTKRYLDSLDRSGQDATARGQHDQFVGEIIEQSVRREAFSSRRQGAPRRIFEQVILGDARRRGETHQWMYDRANLTELLVNGGFEDVRVVDYQTSEVPDWPSYGLDTDATGREYKPNSLYIEAVRSSP